MLNRYIFKNNIKKEYQENFYQYYMRIVLGSKDIVYGETLMNDSDYDE